MIIEQRDWTGALKRASAPLEGDRIVIKMDNGEEYTIEEFRPSASQCNLIIRSLNGSVALRPQASNAIEIGRA